MVDYNSGAAPQPGGYAGVTSAAEGHAVPNAETVGIPAPTEEELQAQAEEAKVQQRAEAEKTMADFGLRQDLLNEGGGVDDEDGELEVPEGDLESRLAWVSEGADYEEKSARGSALYAHEEAVGDVDLEELGAQLRKAVYGDEDANRPPATTEPAADEPSNSRAPQREPEPEPEPVEDYTGEEWESHDALKAEIDSRNEGREDDDLISKGGSSDDLRARLVEDDAAQDAAAVEDGVAE